MSIKPHLRYLRTVLKHKWYVLRFGWHTVPLWRLLIHDASKFSRAEWPAYVNRFAAGRAGKEDKTGDPDAFARAWRHHWQSNPHHWEYWATEAGLISDTIEMPETYVHEMVADWKAASKAYSGKDNCWGWYERTRERQVMHPNTRALVERLLKLGIQKGKAKRMLRDGVRVCMVLDCDGVLTDHPDRPSSMAECPKCGVAQRNENVMFLRQADRENAHKLAER